MGLSDKMKGVFAGLKGTKPTVDSLYFSPGKYWTRIDVTGEVTTRKSGDGLKVEQTIIKVLEDVPGISLRPGQCPARLFLTSGPQADFFKGDVVAFVGSMFGIDPTIVGLDEACAAFDERQLMRNMIAEVDVRKIETKKATDFTKVTYRGAVRPEVVLEALTPDERSRYFPAQYLEKMIEFNKANGIK